MASKPLTKEQFIERCRIIHGDKYEYPCLDNLSTRNKITIRCKEHGEFLQRISAHLDGQGCRKCSKQNCGKYKKHSLEDFIKSSREMHGDKFDYSKFIYKSDKKHGIIKCIKHDDEFLCTPSCHKRMKGGGCSLCAKESFVEKKKNTRERIIAMGRELHGDEFDYSLLPESPHSHDKVDLICNICGSTFSQLLYSHINIGHKCPKCKISKQEYNITKFIESLGISPIIKDRKILDGLEIDILIPTHNMGIEIHGNYWHSELVSKNSPNYHLNKLLQSTSKGVHLIQLFEDELIYKSEICKSIIQYKLNKISRKLYARNCSVKEIDVITKNSFLNDNHIQGGDYSKIKLGLYYDEELVSVMTFGRPRYDKNIEWELIRFSNKTYTAVCGAASKLLTYFEQNYKPKTLISYADRRISDGGLYNSLGFNHVRNSDPRYYYMDMKNYLIRHHRSNFTKKRICEKFSNIYDDSKSEWEMMQLAGYDRIWDCGTKVYIKTY